jgi:GH15 family glucan-1,4-alpha-glucosidase
VLRSLVTLKALTYRPTGGIVAAPTTSLPETLGGARDWDYRYCWLRDATFKLLALMSSGFYEEAVDWTTWLRRAVAGDPAQVQIMYGIEVSDGSSNGRYHGCRVTKIRPLYELVMPLQISCSWTFTTK